jgi:choline transport protein
MPNIPPRKFLIGGQSRFPIFFIWEKATHSPAAATVFMACLFVITCVAFNAVHQTASRLTWSFARDDALFFSKKLSSVHHSLGVPVYALVLDGILVFLVGIVYICSSTGKPVSHNLPSLPSQASCELTVNIAFNSFISTTVIVAQVSFAIPAVLVILRRGSTHFLPESRPFKVPNVVGYICNVVCIIWAVILTVFFCFPATLPVTGGNMSKLPNIILNNRGC